MTIKGRKVINAISTGLWLLTDTLWAFDFNQIAIAVGITLSIVQLLIFMVSTKLSMLMELSIFCWITFNTIWIAKDTYPDRVEIKTSMILMCLASWLTFYFAVRDGLIPKRGKIWK